MLRSRAARLHQPSEAHETLQNRTGRAVKYCLVDMIWLLHPGTQGSSGVHTTGPPTFRPAWERAYQAPPLTEKLQAVRAWQEGEVHSALVHCPWSNNLPSLLLQIAIIKCNKSQKQIWGMTDETGETLIKEHIYVYKCERIKTRHNYLKTNNIYEFLPWN